MGIFLPATVSQRKIFLPKAQILMVRRYSNFLPIFVPGLFSFPEGHFTSQKKRKENAWMVEYGYPAGMRPDRRGPSEGMDGSA
jgi:hypothetical protein